jgi:hypothetical protein
MHSVNDPAERQLIDAIPLRRRRRPGSSTDVELPGGWLLRHHVRPAKRNVLEVFDARRDLVGLVASTGRVSASIDAAWRGRINDTHSERRWWSLAMGHVDRETEASVTFLGRLPNGRPRRTTARHCVQRIAPTLRGCA